jgi:hypothetical protein
VRGLKQCVFRKLGEGEYFLSVYQDNSAFDGAPIVDVSKDNSFYLLNSSAAAVWCLCSKCPTLESLVEEVLLNYKNEDVEQIKSKLLDFLKELYDMKLIDFSVNHPDKKTDSVLVSGYYDEKDLVASFCEKNNSYEGFKISPIVLEGATTLDLGSVPVEMPTCNYPVHSKCMDVLPDIACPC